MIKRKFIIFFIFLSFILFLPLASAGTFNLDTAFSNYDPGEQGYIGEYGNVVISVTDPLDPNLFDYVQFTITVGPDAGYNASIQWFYFNVDPDYAALDVTGDSIGFNVDYAHTNELNKPDGDGFFDVFVNFGPSSGLQTANIVVSVPGVNLSEYNFFEGSVGGSKGSFTFAAHLQTTSTPEGSEFVGTSVPDASIMFLLGLPLLVLGLWGRKKA